MRAPSRPPSRAKRQPPSRTGERPGAGGRERGPDRGFVTASERDDIVRGRWTKSRTLKRDEDKAAGRGGAAKKGETRDKAAGRGGAGAKPGRSDIPQNGPVGRKPFAGKTPFGKHASGKAAQAAQAEGGAPSEPMRIAKAMARAGLCSRRDAERWIADGRVAVNGQTITSPALDVTPNDRIVVDGAALPQAEPIRLWRYYKPKGLVTTHRDPEGRPTVFDQLPSDMPRVISIGRLDFNTEGLLLLTTDGALARHLELPSTGWLRRYRVRAWGRVTQDDLNSLKQGIEIEGVSYGPVEAMLDKIQGDNTWLTIALREGKNREVRKILLTLGLEVNRLIRVSFGPFQLLELQPGDVEIVRRRVMMEQLGPELCRELGLFGDDLPADKPPPPTPKGTKPPVRSRSTEPRTSPRHPFKHTAEPRPAPRGRGAPGPSAGGYDEDET